MGCRRVVGGRRRSGPLPPGLVRLGVEACGICGSDLKLWTRQLPAVEGTAPGHEFVGTILDGPAGPGRRPLRRVTDRDVRQV